MTTKTDEIAAIRQSVLQKRRALSKQSLEVMSQAVVERFFDLWPKKIEWSRSLRVGMYRPLRGEVSLAKLEEIFIKTNVRLHFPRISDREQSIIEFAEVDLKQVADDFTHWSTGPYGIQEPALCFTSVDPAQLDLIFVPGTAFGSSGERIGMGSGYYDRFLVKAPQALLVSLAFDFQFYPELAQQYWDQSVHWVITEKREIKTPKLEPLIACLGLRR